MTIVAPSHGFKRFSIIMEEMKRASNRQFHIHLFLAFLIDVSVGIILVAVPLYLTTLDFSAVKFGLLISAASIGALLIKIPLGMLSDKIGKKPLLYLGFLVMFAGTFFFSLYPDLLPVLRIAQGLALALIWVPFTALFVETFRETDRIASFSGAFMFGLLVGNLLGGILPQFAGFNFTFMLSGGIMLFCAYVLSYIDNPEPAQLKKSTEGKSNLFRLANIWLLGVSNSSALNIFLAFLPLYAARQLNFSPSQIGLLIFLEGITYVLSVVPIGRMADGIGKFRLSASGTGIMLVIFPLFYFSNTFIGLAFASIMFGAITAATMPINIAIAGECMPDKGKAIGTFQTSHDIGALIGPSVAGAVTAFFDVRHAFLGVVPIIILSFFLIFILRNIKNSKSNM